MSKSWKIVSFIGLLMMFCFSQPSIAKLSNKEKDSLKSYLAIVNEHRTFGEYVEAIKSKVSPEDYDILKDIAKNNENKPTPKISVAGANTLEISADALVVRLEVLSLENEIYLINNKKVDLSAGKNLQEKIETILKALPKQSSSGSKGALFRLFLPEAHAFVPIAAWGAWAAWSAISASAVAGVGGAYYANQNQCKELGETLDSCNSQLGVLEGYTARHDALAQQIFGIGPDGRRIRRTDASQRIDLESDGEEMVNLKLWLQYRQRKAKGTCPDFPVNKELDKETAEVVTAARRISEQTTAKLARCQSSISANIQRSMRGEASTVHGLLAKCYKNISLIALDLCLPGSSRIIKDHIREDLESGITPSVEIPTAEPPAPAAATTPARPTPRRTGTR